MEWQEVFPVVTGRSDMEWMARCPAHEDNRASLSVKLTGDKVLLKCFAGKGCSVESICNAVGIKTSDLFLDAKRKEGREKVEAVYSYKDERGRELYQVVRLIPKSFRQRRRLNGRWEWNLKGVNRVPYRLEVITKKAAEPVFIVEGEKDVLILESIGLVATCNSGGAGKWETGFGRYFAGRRIAILPDNDEPGREHAAHVAGSLLLHGASSVRICQLPVKPKGDVSDYLASGGNRADLMRLVTSSPRYVLERRNGK